ncbi:hypothetical protein F5141DRAFT_1186445 [Pisolithus sp. B1]|nr:hypothetical protein F5141DRAFT_1186445 [Pisolithus sp. B1]
MLNLHLCSKGKYACAKDIVDFLAVPENWEQLEIQQPISLSTAHCWMKQMGWKWKQEVKGQYVDGHKCEDVVTYCQNIFLPAWHHLQPQMWSWKVNSGEDNIIIEDTTEPQPSTYCYTVVWFHDKSTFYANDQQKL